MSKKRVLIIGSGGREHALAWKLRQSPELGALYVAPGNAGTALLAQNVPVAATDLPNLVRFVEEHDIDLTVVGPEAPLALGLADLLRARGRRIFGPDAAGARIESSKAFAKEVMTRAGVPTANYAVFDDVAAALAYLAQARYPLVVKADGLAGGKGVTVCSDERQARQTVQALMVHRIHGVAGCRVVIEEALEGREISLLVLTDGEMIVPLPIAQDHKRLLAGDAGPNTGGMGAYAPVPFISSFERDRLVDTLLLPVVATLASMGIPYHGVLYAGLMLTEAGPRVLEFNCRFGDPEAQVILPLLADDLLPWLDALASSGQERPRRAKVATGCCCYQQHMACTPARHAVGVVLAAPGYPDAPHVGGRVEGIEHVTEDVLLFHAGTARDETGAIVTAGGRVITVVGCGVSVDKAAERAYAAIDEAGTGAGLYFADMQYRPDIAWQVRSDSYRGQSVWHAAGRCNTPLQCWKRRIGVLASGNGSNLQALLDACATGAIDAEVAVVISSRKDAYALTRARAAGIPAIALPVYGSLTESDVPSRLVGERVLARTHHGAPRIGAGLATGCRRPSLRDDLAARQRYEHELLDLLLSLQLDLLVLAGWTLILSADFLAQCPWPIINVHPALLSDDGSDWVMRGEGQIIPVLRGLHAVADALALGLPYTGVTVHRVTPEVDAGPIIVQEVVPIEPNDTEETLYSRIKAVEHRLLVEAVQIMLALSLEGVQYA
jgi:phosphoribosylamine--glycine ligase